MALVKMLEITLKTLVLTVLLFIHIAHCQIIPANKTLLNRWFHYATRPRTSYIYSSLAAAETRPAAVIRVMAGGGGDFKTITDAVKSVPDGNKKRVVISIGPGNYTEKIYVGRNKPFITFYGRDLHNPPVLVYGGTAAEYGTLGSATLIVDSDYFSAFNLKVVNSAPRPDGVRVGAQAVAMRISGNAASFYNCRFYGYQDTVCDDKGKHFFKDCYIEGTVDFIFGSGKSIYLNSEIHVIPGSPLAMITAHARTTNEEDTGYVFMHCKVTGGGPGTAYLGRSWFPSPRVVFAYSQLGDVVNRNGWSDNNQPSNDRTVYFGEYKNRGPGASLKRPVPFAKKLSDAEVRPFISLTYVDGAKWLLPPPKV